MADKQEPLTEREAKTGALAVELFSLLSTAVVSPNRLMGVADEAPLPEHNSRRKFSWS